jgi:ATP-dependent RNA/DNA helicase IGHMBP2
VSTHLLCDLTHVKKTADTTVPFVFIDTAGCDLEESGGEAESKSNAGEARLVVQHVQALVKAGLKHVEISVITPYNAQVTLVREMLRTEGLAGVECGTVDGFQGREKEAIVICMVRSNEAREIGFLREDRRMNVAITRARYTNLYPYPHKPLIN